MTRRDEAGPKGPRGPGGDRLLLDWLGLLCIVSFFSAAISMGIDRGVAGQDDNADA